MHSTQVDAHANPGKSAIVLADGGGRRANFRIGCQMSERTARVHLHWVTDEQGVAPNASSQAGVLITKESTERLRAAILIAPCIYCLAKPGELCRSASGKECPQFHMQRVHAGHLTLFARGEGLHQGRPEFFLGKSKGHTRKNWHRTTERIEGKK